MFYIRSVCTSRVILLSNKQKPYTRGLYLVLHTKATIHLFFFAKCSFLRALFKVKQ